VGEHGVARFALGPGLEVRVEPDGDGWLCGPVRAYDGAPAEPGDGAAEALVDLLDVGDPATRPDGFVLRRIAPPPAVRGEHPIDVDQTNRSVVVGDPEIGPAVVVKWWPRLTDADHPAPRLLTHLAEVGYAGVPAGHGLLLWTSPGGRTVPCAMVSAHLPGAVDGWTWCVAAAEREIEEGPYGPGFPATLGRLVAGLHLALATPSSVVAEPVARVGADDVAGWHRAALERLDLATELAGGEALAGSGVAEALAERRDAMTAVLDRLLEVDGTTVQQTHADLHVGQLLRWSAGTAVVDFDGNPVVPAAALQPAARDVAQMLRSLDHVARVADRRMSFTLTSAADAWSERARSSFLAGYRAVLFEAGREELLDLRLLAAFETEQLCREFVYAAWHLPRWAYAPLGGLRQQFPTGDDDAA
jgi:maltokinase